MKEALAIGGLIGLPLLCIAWGCAEGKIRETLRIFFIFVGGISFAMLVGWIALAILTGGR